MSFPPVNFKTIVLSGAVLCAIQPTLVYAQQVKKAPILIPNPFPNKPRQLTPEQQAHMLALREHIITLVQKGDRLRGEGKFDAAVAAYYDAFKVNRGNGAVIVKIAKTLVDKGDINGAIKAYDEIFNRPRDANYSCSERNDLEQEMQYVILLHKAGRYADAFSEYKRARAMHQDELSTGMISRIPLDIVVTEGNAATSQLLVAAHLAAARDISIHGRDEEAAREITEAIRLKPHYGLAYVYLADVLRFLTPEKQKAFGTRRAALEKAVALMTGAVRDNAKSELIRLPD